MCIIIVLNKFTLNVNFYGIEKYDFVRANIFTHIQNIAHTYQADVTWDWAQRADAVSI